MGTGLPRPWFAALVAAAVAGVLYAVVPYSTATELLCFNVPVMVAAAAGLAGLRRQWHRRRGPWLPLAISLGLFCIGELIWFGYLLAGIDPYPSIADAVFLAGYVPLGLTAVLLARDPSGRSEPDRTAWIDAGVLALVAGLLMWATVVERAATEAGLPLAERIFALAYPLTDLLVIGLFLRLLLNRGARTPAAHLFTVGVVFTLIADLWFSWVDLEGAYTPGSFLDTVWVFGYVALGAAPLHASASRPPRPIADDQGLGRGRLLMVLAAVLVPIIALAFEVGGHDDLGANTATLALIVAALVMGLVSLRLWMLLSRTRRIEARRGAERLSALVDHSTDAILLLDADLAVTFASPAAGDVWEADVETLTGRRFLTLLPEGERAGLARQFAHLVSGGADAPQPIEGWLQPVDAPQRAFEGVARNLLANPSVASVVVTLRDVTQRRELEAQLERRAFHDPLTGLANRALFQDRIQHALDRAARQPDACLAVVFIDLDDFKAVNDGMGHGAGDELLIEVGNRLRTCVRPADTVARLGGDEFALLLEDLPGPEQARLLAERAIELLRMPLHVMDVDLAVPASAGVAAYTPGSTVESLLRDADIAMYAAKAAGKCQAAMFDEHLRDVAQQRLALRVALPEALRMEQLRLTYQPIQDLAGRELRGFEALLRWDHPERGEIPPADFIPDAEESGLIIDIGAWVLHRACAQARAWNDRAGRPLTMNVNVSGVQLRHPEFQHEVERALADTGLPAELLTLEITESVLIEHGQDTTILDRLRHMGVGLALDDFGTGYSSLAYLQRFPVTSVKIDRAFISELTRNGDDTLVRSVVAIADALSLTTVAEGVETDSQLDTLHALDCGLAQGFFVGRPQHPHEIDALIDSVTGVPPAAA